MKRSIITLSFGILCAAVISACGGSGNLPNHLGSSLPTATMPPYTGPAQLASFGWGKGLLAGAVLQGPVSGQATVGMQVYVNQRDSAGLVQYAKDVSDPHSVNYRHFLSPTEIADRFGASSSDYQAVAQYFSKYGIHVSAWPQREALFVTGAIGQFEQAFNTKFGVYKTNGAPFIGPITTPHLTVEAPITQVLGMVHLQLASNYLMRPPNTLLRGYSPQQMQRAFDFTGAYSGGFTGSGINVAIIGTGPIASQDAPYLGSIFQAPVATITQVNVTDAGVSAGLVTGAPSPTPFPTSIQYPSSSGFQSPPPVTLPCTGGLPTCNPEDLEAQLDTETVATLAPGAHVLFYLGYNPNDCAPNGLPQNNSPCGAGQGVPDQGIALLDAELQQVIADNTADVVSMSYGLGEPLGTAGFLYNAGYYNALGFGFGPTEFATLVSEGIALFASSGDNGAYECGWLGANLIRGNPPCVSYPAGDPSVVSVGGVTAPLNGDGSLQTQITAWGGQTQNGGSGYYQNDIGSGGGISNVFFMPSWQTAAGIGKIASSYRAQPDVSMMADPNTGPAMVVDAAFPGQAEVLSVGGTSLASPQMAAMWATVLQACKSDAVCSTKGTGSHPYRLGNPAPLLYSIFGNAKQNSSTFYDVIYGTNGANDAVGPPGAGYSAGPGYDLVTGIGVPFAGHLINSVLTNEGSTVTWDLP